MKSRISLAILAASLLTSTGLEAQFDLPKELDREDIDFLIGKYVNSTDFAPWSGTSVTLIGCRCIEINARQKALSLECFVELPKKPGRTPPEGAPQIIFGKLRSRARKPIEKAILQNGEVRNFVAWASVSFRATPILYRSEQDAKISISGLEINRGAEHLAYASISHDALEKYISHEINRKIHLALQDRPLLGPLIRYLRISYRKDTLVISKF